MSSSTLTRREFSVRAALLMLGGAVITISEGCGGGGGGGSSPTGPSNPQPGEKSGTISANHGHVATITAAQLTAGAGLILNIRGQGDHSHTLDLSGAQVVSIAGGARVSKSSSFDDGGGVGNHDHTVTFN